MKETSTPKSLPNLPILGIVGCGNIGGKQAANFLSHGYSVYVYDIDRTSMAKLESLGANITSSCAELASYSDVIFTALPTPKDVMTVVLEGENNLSQGMKSGSVYVDITTNSPKTVIEIHQELKKKGIEMLDAPFNDCSAGAKSQQGIGLALLASGSKETFKRVESILELMADRVIYCGEIGNGTKCKLIHNAVNAIAVQAVSEGITLGLASGIPLETIWDTLRFGSFALNPGDINGLPHYWFSRRCDDLSQHPAFTVKLLHKDLRLALNIAEECNIAVPNLSLTIEDYEEAERRGWSDYATTKVRCLQEERAGVIPKESLSTISNSSQDLSQSNYIKKDTLVINKNKLFWYIMFLLIATVTILQIINTVYFSF